MKFYVDYEHIFFDRYELAESEKKAEVTAILNKVFDKFGYELDMKRNELCIECANFEDEVRLGDVISILKKEFFILLKPDECTITDDKAELDVALKAEEYIKKNYLYDTLTIGEICDYCHVSRRTLDNAFEKRFSKTLSEYIRTARVEEAKRQLAAGEKMEKVAALCGFGSVKTMQRAFKSVCGKTPGEYRCGQLDSEDAE